MLVAAARPKKEILAHIPSMEARNSKRKYWQKGS
jgi:hypothetical protein